jgi:hypothetical protein
MCEIDPALEPRLIEENRSGGREYECGGGAQIRGWSVRATCISLFELRTDYESKGSVKSWPISMDITNRFQDSFRRTKEEEESSCSCPLVWYGR